MIFGTDYTYLLDSFSSTDERSIAMKYLNKIKYDGENEFVIKCLGPVITHIVKQIIDKDGPNKYVIDKKNFLVYMIDVENITNTLIDYCENFLPIAKPYISNLDAQGELLLLFCNNYVFGLIEKLRNSDDNFIRNLKLKELNNYDR